MPSFIETRISGTFYIWKQWSQKTSANLYTVKENTSFRAGDIDEANRLMQGNVYIYYE